MRIYKDQLIKPATEDILVFKLLRRITDENGNSHWETPYMHTVIPDPKDGLILKPVNSVVERHSNHLIIGDENDLVESGLVYAYTERDFINIDYIGMPDCHVWLGIIPKGTECIVSMDGEQIGAKQITLIGNQSLFNNHK